MSAFVVSNKHITAILNSTSPRYPGDSFYYYYQGEPRYVNGRKEEIGALLLAENIRSVNYYYNEQDTYEQFKLDLSVRPLTPVEIIKACDCYYYQACETPDWKDTEAYAIIDTIRERAINNLPGYDEAPWEIH